MNEKPAFPVALVFFFAFMVPACRRGAEEGAGGDAAGSAASANAQQELENQFEDGLRELVSRLERSPDPVAKKELALRAFIENAKVAGAGAGRKLPAVEKAEAELQRMIRAQDQRIEDAVGQLEEKVSALLDGPDRDVDKAAQVFEEFAQGHRELLGQERLEALRQKLQLYQDASIDATARKFKAEGQEDPVQAIAILEGFDPAFDKTPYAEEIRALIRAQYAKYAELRGAKGPAGGSAAPRWGDFDLQAYSVLWPDGGNCVKVEGEVLSIGPNDPKAIENDDKDLNLAAGTCVKLGDNGWIDVELKFEAQFVAGDGIFFGGRGYEGPSGYNFHWTRAADLKIADEEWHTILVKVDGTSMVVSDLTGKQITRNDRLRAGAGPFGIRVAGEKAVLRVRKLQVWVKSRQGGEGGAGEGPEKKEGKKRRASKKGTGA